MHLPMSTEQRASSGRRRALWRDRPILLRVAAAKESVIHHADADHKSEKSKDHDQDGPDDLQ